MLKYACIILLFLPFKNSFSQGCSDAGVCSIGGMKGNDSTKQKFVLTLNNQYGIGEQNVSIFNTQLEAVIKTGKKSSFQIRIPFIFTNGNLGNTNGLGDISTVFSYRYKEVNNWKFGANIGLKIGVNKANIEYTQTLPAANTLKLSLPMPYQTSLGTHDLLLGLDFRYDNKWLFAIGFQMPLKQFNDNTFDTMFVVDGEKAKSYFSSYNLRRKADLVMRIDRTFRLNDKWNFNSGFIPIYHIGNDTRIFNGVESEILNSKGLTLNFAIGTMYKISPNFTVGMSYASPLLVRKVRPDGLTRHFVSALELKYAF